MTGEDPQALQQQACLFRDGFSSVLIATVSPQGEPDISYAPFILDQDQAICIFISELARHTRNLLAHPRASLMFLAEEGASRNLFARQRLILQCRAERLGSDAATPLLEIMEARHGNTVELLRSLPDFHLFRLQVENGSFIKGFGQAWSLHGNALNIEALRRG